MGKPKIEGAGVNESTYFAMGEPARESFPELAPALR